MEQLDLFAKTTFQPTLGDIVSAKPNFDMTFKIKVSALAPLSMNNSVPGKFYPTGYKPSQSMIMGMIENAMGLYVDDNARKELNKLSKKKTGVGKALETSASKYISLLQHHIRIDHITESFAMKFTDYFSQQFNRIEGSERINGGASYCYSILNKSDDLLSIAKISAKNRKLLTELEKENMSNDEQNELGEKKKENLDNKEKELGLKVAHYYTSPSQREYIEPLNDFIITLSSSSELSKVIKFSLTNPESPLFLGTNDGWVDVEVVNE